MPIRPPRPTVSITSDNVADQLALITEDIRAGKSFDELDPAAQTFVLAVRDAARLMPWVMDR